MKRWHGLVVRQQDERFIRRVERRCMDDLPPGEITIHVHYSSLNYKDALSASGNRGVTRRYPHTPGIDAMGEVLESENPGIAPGDQVLCMGFDLGMNTPGGFGQIIRVPADWVIRLPAGISGYDSMCIGTAGFTAAQCVHRLLELAVTPDRGKILVTGATGGVGSVAVLLLSELGFSVIALTGKIDEKGFLEELGADAVLERKKFLAGGPRMILRERWAGVVDTVGGEILARAVKSCCYGGVVTCCGNVASGELPLNVYPFILRGVTLAGIDSAKCSRKRRERIWHWLEERAPFEKIRALSRRISLADLDGEIETMLAGESHGRVVVDLEKGYEC